MGTRRIEITVPLEWSDSVRSVLEAPEKPPEKKPTKKALARAAAKAAAKAERAKQAAQPPTIEQRMVAIYEKFNPEKVREVPSLLEKYAGQEELMLQKLEEKYGPVPVVMPLSEDEATDAEEDAKEQRKKEREATKIYGCNLSDAACPEKPNMVCEIPCRDKTIFLVTVPGPAVSGILRTLKTKGIGSKVGRIILTTLDFAKPTLDHHLIKPEIKASVSSNAEEGEGAGGGDEGGAGGAVERKKTKKQLAKEAAAAKKKKLVPLKGFAHFAKARQTTEELYNSINQVANMNMNTWANLFGACTMAAGGLATNVNVFIVAAMLVSPVMGPIQGMTFGYRVADWPLFKIGFINEVKMAFTAWAIGAVFGALMGDIGNTYKWPNSAMMPEGQAFNLVISIIVSGAAGVVLGVALTSGGNNQLVGTAISGGLLPPLVNAGMLMSYSTLYGSLEKAFDFYEMGIYALLFYLTHVVTIIVIANMVFWLKEIDPRFKDGEDSSFDDLLSVQKFKGGLQDKSVLGSEMGRGAYFFRNIVDDVKNFALDTKDRITGTASAVSSVVIDGTKKAAGGLGRAVGITGTEEEEGASTAHRRGSRAQQNPMHASSIQGIEEGEVDDADTEHEGGGGSKGKPKSKGFFEGLKDFREQAERDYQKVKEAVMLPEDKRRYREYEKGINEEDDEDEEDFLLLPVPASSASSSSPMRTTSSSLTSPAAATTSAAAGGGGGGGGGGGLAAGGARFHPAEEEEEEETKL